MGASQTQHKNNVEHTLKLVPKRPKCSDRFGASRGWLGSQYVYARVYSHVYTHVYAHVYTQMSTHMSTHMSTWMSTHISATRSKWMSTRRHLNTCPHICLHTCQGWFGSNTSDVTKIKEALATKNSTSYKCALAMCSAPHMFTRMSTCMPIHFSAL